MALVYGIGGLISVPQGAITGRGAPNASFKGQLGQQYFDITDAANPVLYIFNGASWNIGGNAEATTTAAGIVLLDLTVTGADTDATVPTSLAVFNYGQSLVLAGANPWSETVSGIGQLATQAETNTGTDDTVAITPLKLAGALVASLPITGGAGSFTTLAASGLASLSGSATITTGATALNLASDASTGAVNIGTGAGARAITIGNVTGATAVTVNVGTGNFTVNTTGAGDVVLNSADTVLIDSAGVLELNSSAGVIGIGNDAVAQNINIGTGAAARVITLGNSSGATQVVVNGGTAGVNLGVNAIAQPVTIGNSTGATSVVIDSGTGPINIGTNAIAHIVTLGNVTGVTAVNINAGTGGSIFTTTNSTLALRSGTGAIQIGVDAAAHTITIGNITGATAINHNSGTGANLWTTTNGSWGLSTGTGAINIGTDAVAKTITLGNITGATAVVINSGSGAASFNTTNGAFTLATGTGALNLGTDAVAKIITVGNITGATALNLLAGTGNFSLDGVGATTYTFAPSTTGGTINIGGTGANTGTVTLFGGTGAQTINFASSTGGKTLNIANGAGANLVTIGSVTGASSLSLLVGTGNFSLDGAATSTYTFAPSVTSGTINFGGTGANVGTATILGGTGAQTVNIANSTGGKTVNIATGAGVNVVTIGSTNTTSATTINSGSGNVNIVGNLSLSSVATQLQMNGGAVTDFIGTLTLIGGTLVVANTNIAANDRIFFSRIAVNASTALGFPTYTISAGASFTVTSMGATTATILVADVSTFSYFIVRQT